MKEIAFQAGVSLATVDRYLHNRPGLRTATRARIDAAIAELDIQYANAALHGARLSLDVVMDAPDRFTSECKAAFEAEMPSLRPATLRCRFHLSATWAEGDIIRLLAQIQKRGSHGVVLKVRATPAIADQVRALVAAGIPVVTFVTDLKNVARLAYVGMDNTAAGRSVAWLMAGMLRQGHVLMTTSNTDFLGEQDRVDGFTAQMTAQAPRVKVTALHDGRGQDRDTGDQVAAMLNAHPDINAVYSSGGANAAILEAFAAQGRTPTVIVGHDLDRTNTQLLHDGKLTFIVHHDLREDARRVFQHMLQFHRMLPETMQITKTQFSIVTPFSIAAKDAPV